MARIFFESRDLAADNRRRPASSEREAGSGERAAGDFIPPMDVLDTDAGLEIVLDLPGVAPDAVTIVVRDGVLLVSGVKPPTRCRQGHAAFHLAERGFGRFTRAVRVAGAFDARQATSTFAAGELRIALPRRVERRGEEIRIRVGGADARAAGPDA